MEKKQKIVGLNKRHFIFCFTIIFFQCFFSVAVHSQQTGMQTSLVPVQDVGDVIRKIFNKEKRIVQKLRSHQRSPYCHQ